MRSQAYVLTTLLLSAASVVWAGPLDARSGLMKRHYWCNGIDSEDICQEGDTMVPIDQYACDHIAAAGRLDEISAPVNGETHTDCGGAGTGGDSPSSTLSTTPPATSTPPPAQTEEKPAKTEEKPESGSSGHDRTVHLKCTKTGGSDNDTELDCTFVRASG